LEVVSQAVVELLGMLGVSKQKLNLTELLLQVLKGCSLLFDLKVLSL
jgi:hypothetical protein